MKWFAFITCIYFSEGLRKYQSNTNKHRALCVTNSSKRKDSVELNNIIGENNRKGSKSPLITASRSTNPESFAILGVYFVQGALGLSDLAVTFFLKDSLHLNPAQSAALLGVTTIPWVIKPLYGLLSDVFPLFGYKRKSYLILAGIVGCLSWLSLGTIVHDASAALIAKFLGSMSVAFSDVVIDSIVVERSRIPNIINTSSTKVNDFQINATDVNPSSNVAGNLQSLCWGSAAVGGILSAYFSGSLLEILSVQNVFCITAIFPLFISTSSLFIQDEREIHDTNDMELRSKTFNYRWAKITTPLTQLYETLKNPAIYLPVFLIFLWRSTPSPESAMFYFYTNELKFDPEFLGRIRLASSVAALTGVITYRTWLKDVPIKNIIFWSTITSFPLGLLQVLLTTHYNRVMGIPDELFTLTDSVVLTVLSQVAFMPTLALATSLCPPGIEGTLFASLMSIYNASGTLSNEISAALTSLLNVDESNFENLTWLVTICNFSSLLPLPLMNSLLSDKKELADSS